MIGEIEISKKHTAVVDAYKINPFDLCSQARHIQKNANDIHSVSNNIIIIILHGSAIQTYGNISIRPRLILSIMGL